MPGPLVIVIPAQADMESNWFGRVKAKLDSMTRLAPETNP